MFWFCGISALWSLAQKGIVKKNGKKILSIRISVSFHFFSLWYNYHIPKFEQVAEYSSFTQTLPSTELFFSWKRHCKVFVGKGNLQVSKLLITWFIVVLPGGIICFSTLFPSKTKCNYACVETGCMGPGTVSPHWDWPVWHVSAEEACGGSCQPDYSSWWGPGWGSFLLLASGPCCPPV